MVPVMSRLMSALMVIIVDLMVIDWPSITIELWPTLMLTFWPASLLAGLATSTVWRARAEAPVKFLLAWLVPTWIVFELVITKLPHYVLPLYPAIAILAVGALERRVLSRKPWIVRGTAWWFVVPAGGSVLAIVGAITLTRQPVFLAWPFVAAALIFGLIAWWMYDDGHAERSLLNAVVASLFLSLATYGAVAPALTRLFPSPEIARAIETRAKTVLAGLRTDESATEAAPRPEKVMPPAAAKRTTLNPTPKAKRKKSTA